MQFRDESNSQMEYRVAPCLDGAGSVCLYGLVALFS